MSKNIRWWKISPGQGGKYWNHWLDNNFCALYDWPEKSYYDKTNMNLKDKYSNSDDFLDNTDFRGKRKHDWRCQLKTFAWDVTEGDIAFAYKHGQFVGYGKLGRYYFNKNEWHARDIDWKEFNPPINLKGTDLFEVLKIPTSGTIKNIDTFRDEIIRLLENDGIDIRKDSSNANSIDLLTKKSQIIFYGPPGTGKTYKAREIAVDFIEGLNEF